MSYQLIHTSAATLLDSQSPGYGTVARTEHMPQALCHKLGALSVYREPRGGPATRGPQFSYHIIELGGKNWHVLSCVQPAGADYSGRACLIAHHLVLSTQEVESAIQSEERPTPAGVALALLEKGFWKSSWKGAPSFIKDEPEINPGDLPIADTQQTWKLLTGHKANARAFFTPPYDRDCLISVTQGLPVQQVLLLLHESDWLTHTRGWGVSFSTEADDADTFTETLRMVCSKESPLIQRAIRTGHPVLPIEQGLEIPLPKQEPPGSLPLTPGKTPQQGNGIVRAVARSVTHYHYTEEADWLLYDVTIPRRRSVWGAVAGLGLLATGFAAGGIYLSGLTDSPINGNSVTSFSNTDARTQVGVQELTALLSQPYNHDETVRLMRRISAIPEAQPEDSLLIESAALLLAAQQQGVQHTKVMKRLCECARLLGVRDTDLVSLYLREATNGMPVDEWQQQFTGEHYLNWLSLKTSEPQLADIMNQPDLQAYAPAAVPKPVPTVLATADSTTAPPEPPSQSAGVMPDRLSLIPQTAIAGASLPPALEAAIPALPMSITSGAYVVSRFATGGVLESAQRLELSPEGYHLYITPTGTEGVYCLKPEHKDGKQPPLPTVEFSIKAGRLHQIRSGENEAVVCFPVPDNEHFLTNVVMVPSFALPIPRGKDFKLPPAAKVDLKITPGLLEVMPPSQTSPYARLNLKKRKGFPWSVNRKDTDTIRFALALPVLTGHNSVKGNSDADAGYVWTKASVKEENATSTQFQCEVEYRPALPECLEQRFNEVANTPCCGEAPRREKHLTLATLYYVTCALANEKLTSAERKSLHQMYYQLFADETNNGVLRKVLANDPELYVTPAEATGRGLKAVHARRRVTKMLAERKVRDRLRNLICGVLTRSLVAAYTKEQNKVDNDMKRNAVFTLNRIDVGNHVELIWQFRPHPDTQKKP